ncbi:nuclear transport factor 2 family protein [uncultured Sphingomonas sp.]|uniref:nuclear transport factor 2 family protein n=1 Tax=uncultured Sphingomonas sp. TaxID=158754 RepID=UPI0035CC8847
MTKTPLEVIRAILDKPTDLASVEKLVAPDATYVSLNHDNPSLKRLMPWAGTSHDGGRAVVATYEQVGRYWSNEELTVEDELETGDRAAVFGRFTYRSKSLGKIVTSPFAILARVTDGRVTHMQFMEDTFATADSFRVGGEAVFRADPDGGEVVL